MPSESNPAFRALDAVSSAVFRAGSTVRRRRIFHPAGAAYHATVEIQPSQAGTGLDPLGVPLLDSAATYPGIVRFSRGAGLPEPLPDILGLAVRICDAQGDGQPQDLLFTSSGPMPGARQLIFPSTGFGVLPLSSVLPYRLGDAGIYLFGARIIADKHARYLTRMSDVDAAAEEGTLQFELMYARRTGDWRRFALVDVGARLSDAEAEGLHFNVVEDTSGAITPTGWLQALRRHAYAASQAGRPS